jgi:hypothetical protein
MVMTLQGVVYDTSTDQPVSNASLSIVNAAGSSLGGGTAADGNGIFNITSSLLDSGGKLLVSSVGYSSVIADPSVIASTGMIGLNQSPQTLPAAVVTPGSNAAANSTNYLPYVLGGGALLLLLGSGSRKKKAITGINVDWTKIAITGGVLVGGYFAGKAILQKLGIISTPNPVTVATTTTQTAALQSAITAAQQTGTAAATYTQDQYTGWANDIFNLATATSGGVPSSTQDAIVQDVINVNTMVDLQSLISAFGVRSANCLIFGLDCKSYDLPSFLKAALDSTHINTINGYLSDQNINYQF